VKISGLKNIDEILPDVGTTKLAYSEYAARNPNGLTATIGGKAYTVKGIFGPDNSGSYSVTDANGENFIYFPKTQTLISNKSYEAQKAASIATATDLFKKF
jgi:hypothetical protein